MPPVAFLWCDKPIELTWDLDFAALVDGLCAAFNV